MRTRRIVVAGIVWLASFGVLGHALPQTPTVSEVQRFDEDDLLLLRTLQTLGDLANAECAALSSMKRFSEQRDQILTRIDTKHGGIDWAKADVKAGTYVSRAKP